MTTALARPPNGRLIAAIPHPILPNVFLPTPCDLFWTWVEMHLIVYDAVATWWEGGS